MTQTVSELLSIDLMKGYLYLVKAESSLRHVLRKYKNKHPTKYYKTQSDLFVQDTHSE